MSDLTRPPDNSGDRVPTHPDFAAPGRVQGGRSGYPDDRSYPTMTPYTPQSGHLPPAGPPRPPGHTGPQTDPRQGRPAQRPAMITLSLVLIVTGSLVWMAALGFVWIFVYIARDSFSYSGVEGAIYHLLEGFHLRMLRGLAFVLFGAPTAALVLSFFLLRRVRWPRIAISAVGAAGLVVCGIMLAGDLNWMIPGAAYIAFACVILWTPAVTRWCSGSDEESQPDRHPVQGPTHRRSW